MNDTLKAIGAELAKTVPSLLLFVLVAWMFLTSMDKRDALLKQISDQCMEARGVERAAIVEARTATEKHTEAIVKMVMALDKQKR